MSDTATGATESAVRPRDEGGHFYHHGRSPAAWVGSMATMVAFVVGFFAVVPVLNPVIGIVAAAILLVGLIAAQLLRSLGYGQRGRRR